MTLTLNVNGVIYAYPETGESSWGVEASGWASAITAGVLQKAGGSFVLLDEVDFGPTYGLKSLYYKSRSTNPASAGQVRFARSDAINWRNQANDADISLEVDSSNRLKWNSSILAKIGDSDPYPEYLLADGSRYVSDTFVCLSGISIYGDTVFWDNGGNNNDLNFIIDTGGADVKTSTITLRSRGENRWQLIKKSTSDQLWLRDAWYGQDIAKFEFNAGDNALYVQAGGNIGLGNNNPGTKLDITGNDFRIKNSVDSAVLCYLDSGTTTTQYVQLLFQDQGVTKWILTKDNNNKFRLYDDVEAHDVLNVTSHVDNANAIVVTSGYVGLGTVLPSEKLHVAGNGYVTGDFTVDGDINGNLTGDVTGNIAAATGSFSSSLTTSGSPVVIGETIANVVEDLTPQLGGDLDVNGKTISAANGIVTIKTPTGGGGILISGEVDNSSDITIRTTQTGANISQVTYATSANISTTVSNDTSIITDNVYGEGSYYKATAYGTDSYLHHLAQGTGSYITLEALGTGSEIRFTGSGRNARFYSGLHVGVSGTFDAKYSDASIRLPQRTTAQLDAEGAGAGDQGRIAWNTTTDSLKMWNGSEWASPVPFGDLVDDTTPQLGGDLDVNGKVISAASGNVNLNAISNGQSINLEALGTSSAVNLGARGAGSDVNLTASGTSSAITLAANGNTTDINLVANGTGSDITIDANGVGAAVGIYADGDGGDILIRGTGEYANVSIGAIGLEGIVYIFGNRLEIDTDASVQMPQRTTAELAAEGLGAGDAGSVAWNTTNSKLQVWTGSAWVNLH